jgi:hypothetical protein
MHTAILNAIVRWRKSVAYALLLSAMVVSCNSHKQSADKNFDTAVPHPAYIAEHPRVLFDEAHRNIHTADGLYRPFVELLRNDGYEVLSFKRPFSAATLAEGRILVIANALGPNESNDSSAFTPMECEAVHSWVGTGGALLLITDHAPTGFAARCIAHHFGVEMSYGMTEDSLHYDTSTKDFSRLLFTREGGLLVEHPIISGRDATERVNRIMTFTGQSMKVPERAVGFLKLAASAVNRPASIRVDKTGGDTKVEITYGDPVSADGFVQGEAFKYGKGRIVMLGEAAMLTAQIDGTTRQPFGMNVPGVDNRQLALNIMHWLSGLL